MVMPIWLPMSWPAKWTDDISTATTIPIKNPTKTSPASSPIMRIALKSAGMGIGPV